MATNKSDPTAQQYAKALFAIGTEKQCVGQVYDELSALTQVYREDSGFRNFFTSPKVPGELKEKAVLSALGGAGEITRGFVTLLIRKRREALLDNIMDAFGTYRDDAESRVHVWVESAAALTEVERSGLVSELSKATHKTVSLHETVRPELLGGLRVRIGDSLLDNSLRSRLEALSANLAELDRLGVGDSALSDADELFSRTYSDVMGK